MIVTLNDSVFKQYVNYEKDSNFDRLTDLNKIVKSFSNQIEVTSDVFRAMDKEDVLNVISGFGAETNFLEETLKNKLASSSLAERSNKDVIRNKLMKILELSAGIYQVKNHKEINSEIFSIFIAQRVKLIVADSPNEHRLMIYNYNTGTYSSDIEPCKLIIFRYLQFFAFGEELALSTIESKVIEYLKKSVKHIDAAKFDTNYFSLLNCDLKFYDGTILPHSPSHLTTMQSGVPFNLTATAPNFKKFLNDTFTDKDTISFLQEFFGYCLISAQKAQMFLVIVGPGANGKSVLVSLLSKLVGTSNVSAVPFEDLNSPFSLQPMIGKKINIATENTCQIASSSKLKAITSGDEVSINRKNLPEIAIKLPIKLVFVLNANPLFNDKSYGLARRLYLLRMDKVVDKSEQDPHLGEQLSTELPGILNWSLDGLKRLIQNDFRFTSSKSMEEAKKRILEKTSPVAVFVKEIVVLQNGNVMKTREVHDYFLNWCNSKGIMIGEYTSAAKFWKIFSEEFLLTFNLVLRRGKSGTSIVRDIGLK